MPGTGDTVRPRPCIQGRRKWEGQTPTPSVLKAEGGGAGLGEAWVGGGMGRTPQRRQALQEEGSSVLGQGFTLPLA